MQLPKIILFLHKRKIHSCNTYVFVQNKMSVMKVENTCYHKITLVLAPIPSKRKPATAYFSFVVSRTWNSRANVNLCLSHDTLFVVCALYLLETLINNIQCNLLDSVT